MKKTLLVVASVIAFSSASAQAPSKWLPLSNSAYVLKPIEGRDIMLMASIDNRTKAIAINILNIDSVSSFCGKGEIGNDADLGALGPYKVNGRFVRFAGACIGGNEIAQPATDDGKDYLNNLANSGSTIEIDFGAMVTLHYQTTGFSEAKSKILETLDAL